MQDTTLVLLLKDEPPTEVLLGYKKMGFGQGKYTGFGGKIEPGETVAEAAARELAEETGILLPVTSLEYVSTLMFIFPHKPEWSQRVHVFTAHKWDGEPAESKEMHPQWFVGDAIPYDQMWATPVTGCRSCYRGRSSGRDLCSRGIMKPWVM